MSNAHAVQQVPQSNHPLVGPQQGGSDFNPREYQFSSGAICFAALMDVIKAYEEMQNDWAISQIGVINSRASATDSQAQAVYKSYDSDAQSLRFQGYESMADGFSSLFQVGASLGAMAKTQGSANESSNMEALNKDMNTKIDSPDFTIDQGGFGPQTAKEAFIEDKKQEILNGTFDYSKVSKGVDSDLGNNTTFKEVIESAKSERELNAMKSRVARARELAAKKYNSAQTYAQTLTTMFQNIGQGGASFGKQAAKNAEADAMVQKAEANKEQTYAAATAEFGKETTQNMEQGRKQGTDGFSQTMNMLNQMIQTDVRG